MVVEYFLPGLELHLITIPIPQAFACSDDQDGYDNVRCEIADPWML